MDTKVGEEPNMRVLAHQSDCSGLHASELTGDARRSNGPHSKEPATTLCPRFWNFFPPQVSESVQKEFEAAGSLKGGVVAQNADKDKLCGKVCIH